MDFDANMIDINMILGDQQIVMYLEDNSASRDLVSQLPLTVELEDFGGGKEKIFYTPKELDLSEVRYLKMADEGTVAIYEPWGNVCIFLKPLSRASGLVGMGHVTKEDLEILKSTSATSVTLFDDDQ